jgi:hypothetical protein
MKIILTSIFLACTLCVTAQSSFYKISLGAGAGMTRSYADLQEKNYAGAFYGTADYLFTPFISLGMEVQSGKIEGGQRRPDLYGRRFTNNYQSFTLNGKMALGQIINYKHHTFLSHLKGLYVGSGIGFIQNGVDELSKSLGNVPNQVYLSSSTEPVIPFNLGLNYFFPNRNGQYKYVANINVQSNITIGEGMDGYDTTFLTLRNGKADIFSFFSFGIKYNFGLEGFSEKTFKKY